MRSWEKVSFEKVLISCDNGSLRAKLAENSGVELPSEPFIYGTSGRISFSSQYLLSSFWEVLVQEEPPRITFN